MNGLVFYIGLGAGLAAACGLRPFLPLLLAGALGSAAVLGASGANESAVTVSAATMAARIFMATALQDGGGRSRAKPRYTRPRLNATLR